ncbi:MAG: tRNA lysidine(34) synthetase TilS [Acidobacteriaceae bacterium]|nr:tRNA lysidine(34) synthetase TilS [Acidobacteriaceae bacterium]MBV9781758.1 tRNA lysidine(34) synthetase TilS [Acidobacteriaceae bacterium]
MSMLADTLLDRVAEIITRYNMLARGDRVGVAVSGGADSVVLLHLLHRLSEKLGIELLVLHLNHGFRGAESEADAEWVKSLAETLGLPCRIDCSKAVSSGNLEQAWREARRNFYRRSMNEHSLQRVALGHTRSDQAETVLLRLLRGSGTAGLAGMRMVTQEGLIRPLLTTSREEVRRWAEGEGIGWREDSSNANLQFSRNRLRHEIVPILARDFNSNIEEILARTAELAQAEEDYWAREIEPAFERIATRTRAGLILDVSALAGFDSAVRRRILRRAMNEARGDLRGIEMRHVDAILELCRSTAGHDRTILPRLDALRSFDKLRLAIPNAGNPERGYRIDLEIGRVAELPFEAGSISLNWAERESSFCASFKGEQNFGVETIDLNADTLTGQGTPRSIYVRNWAPGDALQRSGHAGLEKVKSLFQEHRVLLWERRHWPVVISGEEIVWVRQFGSAAKFGSSMGSDRVIRLIYRPGTPEKRAF